MDIRLFDRTWATVGSKIYIKTQEKYGPSWDPYEILNIYRKDDRLKIRLHKRIGKEMISREIDYKDYQHRLYSYMEEPLPRGPKQSLNTKKPYGYGHEANINFIWTALIK